MAWEIEHPSFVSPPRSREKPGFPRLFSLTKLTLWHGVTNPMRRLDKRARVAYCPSSRVIERVQSAWSTLFSRTPRMPFTQLNWNLGLSRNEIVGPTLSRNPAY